MTEIRNVNQFIWCIFSTRCCEHGIDSGPEYLITTFITALSDDVSSTQLIAACTLLFDTLAYEVAWIKVGNHRFWMPNTWKTVITQIQFKQSRLDFTKDDSLSKIQHTLDECAINENVSLCHKYTHMHSRMCIYGFTCGSDWCRKETNTDKYISDRGERSRMRQNEASNEYSQNIWTIRLTFAPSSVSVKRKRWWQLH